MALHLNKPGIRVLGIAESFIRSSPKSKLAGVVMRADLRIDGIAVTSITVSGDDATEGVLDIFKQLDRRDVNVVLLNGAVISWFNIIDLQEVYSCTGVPIVCLTYEESPGLERYIMEYFPDPGEKLSRYGRLGERSTVHLKTGYDVLIRALGLDIIEARSLLDKFALDGRVPEPLRIAGMVARATLRSELSLDLQERR